VYLCLDLFLHGTSESVSVSFAVSEPEADNVEALGPGPHSPFLVLLGDDEVADKVVK